jgi:hypothetical protein
VDAHVFHLGDEVEDIAAATAFAETVPDVLADTDPELCRVAAFMDGAWTAEAVRATFEFVQNAVMLQDLFHGDGRFDGFEVNEG